MGLRSPRTASTYSTPGRSRAISITGSSNSTAARQIASSAVGATARRSTPRPSEVRTPNFSSQMS